MFERTFYFLRMNIYKNKNYIFGLTGMRETGKTTIFLNIIDYLRKNKLADEFHIIHINLEALNNENYRDIIFLQNYLDSKILDDKKYFLFLDEIQYLIGFEKFLVNFHNIHKNVKIFISCSNSRLLTNEISSNLNKIFKLFYITPFSYKETCDFLKTNPRDKNMLTNYIYYGGLPARLIFKKSSEVKRFLYSTLDSIFLRDIVMRLNMTDIDKLNFVLKLLTIFLGKNVSYSELLEKADKIAPDFKITRENLYDCIDVLTKSLIIRYAKGYNLNTNQVLPKSMIRLYFSDLAFLNIYGFDIKNNMDAVFKNLVWLELIRRGYEVYTGINEDITIDFVAIRNEKTMFIQVLYLIEDGNTANIEAAKLNSFETTHPRYILSMDKTNFSRNGVIHENILNFLLNDKNDIEDITVPTKWVTIE